VTRAAPDVRVPLFWYLTITVAVPAVHGVGSDPAFLGHAGTVVAVAAALAVVRFLLSRLRRMASSRP
jgi:hypothetical protein